MASASRFLTVTGCPCPGAWNERSSNSIIVRIFTALPAMLSGRYCGYQISVSYTHLDVYKRQMREEIESVFNLPPDKISIIPNGIRPAAFQVSSPDPAVRQRFAASQEKILFFIGRLVREKGVQVLLEACLLYTSRCV